MGVPLRDAIERHRDALLALPGAIGVGEGDGCVLLLTRAAPPAAGIPADIEGWPVRVRVVGEVRAERSRARPDGGSASR